MEPDPPVTEIRRKRSPAHRLKGANQKLIEFLDFELRHVSGRLAYRKVARLSCLERWAFKGPLWFRKALTRLIQGKALHNWDIVPILKRLHDHTRRKGKPPRWVITVASRSKTYLPGKKVPFGDPPRPSGPVGPVDDYERYLALLQKSRVNLPACGPDTDSDSDSD